MGNEVYCNLKEKRGRRENRKFNPPARFKRFHILKIYPTEREPEQTALRKFLPVARQLEMTNHWPKGTMALSLYYDTILGQEFVVVVDRVYIALFSTLKQTHCARM